MSKLKIYVAGHNGMVGSAIIRLLKKKRNVHLITKEKKDLDLTNQKKVYNFLQKEKPNQIYLAAAKVGGILANSNYPAEFIHTNLVIQTNVIHGAFLNGVKKLLFLGSSCIYPKFSNKPIKEEKLLNGKLEPTNEAYAIAKIAGIKLCESYNRQYGKSHKIDYRSVMPTNLYGAGDNYNLETSHVIPALIRKFHEAKIKKDTKVTVWGTGKQKREFLNVDDLAKACIFVMNIKKKIYYRKIKPMCSHLNVGTGVDITIKDLATMIKSVVGYNGVIEFDKNKPDGMKKKLLDVSIINGLGWKAKCSLKDGIDKAYNNFIKYYHEDF
jgi:GDP-L-fucose synthase